MSIQIDTLKNIETTDLNKLMDKYESALFNPEKEQMRDQIEMLEREVERQEIIIDALIKAIKVIERG